MMLPVVLALAVTFSGLTAPFTRATNSYAAARRGVKAWAAKQYAEAAAAFGAAQELDPRSTSLFNLGTAQIAAGHREEGSAALSRAMEDPRLRASALYNRGNSALAANAYDYAIRDYIESLRLRPSNMAAKRNLEIALMRKAAAQQSQSSPKGKQPGTQQPQPQPQDEQHGGAKPEPKKGDANAEALLRAVQQQEQEEMQRMKRARAERGRVGW